MTKAEFIEQAAIKYAVDGNVKASDAWSLARDLAGACGDHKWTATVAHHAPAASASGSSTNGPRFPPFGKNAGEPVMGASERNLRFYAGAAVRTLSDPAKERFHSKERESLAAYVAELERQGFDASEFRASAPVAAPKQQEYAAHDDESEIPF